MNKAADSETNAWTQKSQRRLETKLGSGATTYTVNNRASSLPRLTPSISMSRPLMSINTGMRAMSPLGPSMQNARSHSRGSEYVTKSANKHIQSKMSKALKANIALNPQGLGSKKLRFNEQLRSSAQVLPGNKEIRDEAIRTQLLIGKLRSDGHNNIINRNNAFKRELNKELNELKESLDSKRP